MKCNFKLISKSTADNYVRAAVISILFLLLSANRCFSGDRQLRGLVPSNTNNQANFKETVDSVINKIALEINTLVSQKDLSKTDSDHLKELSSRLTLLSSLESNIQSASNNGNNIQQDKLSIAALAFGLAVTLSILFFQFRERSGINYMTFKLLGMVFIGTVSVFLIPAGFANEQITPVVGLLGTLAGYLIGSSRLTTQESPNNGKQEAVPK